MEFTDWAVVRFSLLFPGKKTGQTLWKERGGGEENALFPLAIFPSQCSLRPQYLSFKNRQLIPFTTLYQARLSISELDLAKKDFELVLKIDPKNREAQQQLNLVNKNIKQHTAKEKVIFGKYLVIALFSLKVTGQSSVIQVVSLWKCEGTTLSREFALILLLPLRITCSFVLFLYCSP